MKRKVPSTQSNIPFVFCGSPVTIDKSAAWGPGNMQLGPDGAFLKMKSVTEVSHLVQPNEAKTAPVGWIPGDGPGLFHKEPIWIDDELLEPGTKKHIQTLDGPIDYEVTEPSYVCFNCDEDGNANPNDSWVQKESDVNKNYVIQQQ